MKFIIFETWDAERAKLQEVSEKYGFTYETYKEALTLENVHLCKGFDGVSTLGRSSINEDVLRALSEMGVRYYATRTIGYNHVDLAAAKKYGVKVCNSSYPPDSVAEFTVMLILMSLRKYKQTLWRQQVNDYSLFGLMGSVLGKMTVGVMGGGKIGTKVMEILKGFGCRILCYSDDRRPEVEALAEYVDEDTMYALSDIITYHVPCLPTTRHMLNDDTLAKMKDGVVLVNTARGELFDIQTLIKGVESKKIGALAMELVSITSWKSGAVRESFPRVVKGV